MARIVFGLALIPVGLSHLVYPDAVSLVPAWLPFRMFWLYATGIGLCISTAFSGAAWSTARSYGGDP
jgi:hypothetical protein